MAEPLHVMTGRPGQRQKLASNYEGPTMNPPPIIKLFIFTNDPQATPLGLYFCELSSKHGDIQMTKRPGAYPQAQGIHEAQDYPNFFPQKNPSERALATTTLARLPFISLCSPLLAFLIASSEQRRSGIWKTTGPSINTILLAASESPPGA